MLLLLQAGNSLIQTYTDAYSWQKMLQFQISETWNIAGLSPYYITTISRYKVQSGIYNLPAGVNGSRI